MGCRRLYALVKNLPPDAALWRTQENVNGDHSETIRTNDPDEIREFLANANIG